MCALRDKTLNNGGQSVLHAACEYGNTEIVDILLRSNSNVNQCDKAKNSKTPLFIATVYITFFVN
jgi:ankyrin repeat protein